MKNNKWECYNDSNLLFLREITEDTYEAVKARSTEDNKAQFLHTMIFCRDYLATSSGRSALHDLLGGFDEQNIENFIGSTDMDVPFDYPLLASRIAETREDGIVLTVEDALEEVYRITGIRCMVI